jgi:hypothetical protein
MFIDEGEPGAPGRERPLPGSDDWRLRDVMTPRPLAAGSPPQGEHHAAGARPEHHRADGGLGLGHRAPAGWPEYHPPGRGVGIAPQHPGGQAPQPGRTISGGMVIMQIFT